MQASRTRSRLANQIQPTLGGELLAPLRHQATIVRTDALGNADHLLGGGHFQIQGATHLCPRLLDILQLDVSPVLAQMHGDAVCPSRLSATDRFRQVRVTGMSLLPQSRNVINVHAQSNSHWIVCPLALINQKQKLLIFLFRVFQPFMGPTHMRHNIPLVVHFPNLHDLAVASQYIVQFFGSAASRRTIR